MDNPLRIIRTYNGYTLEKISTMTDVTRQYIDQLEKGFYEVPNFSVLRAYSNITGNELSVGELNNSYSEWRIRNRLESVKRYGLQPIKEHLMQPHLTRKPPVDDAGGVKVVLRQPNFISDRQPRYRVFKNWREFYFTTQYEFCVAMCVRPRDVSRYEIGHARGMPHTLQVAMGNLTEGFAVEYR
jgi:transcriptional regulator with XRE-family HTH domain